MIGLFPGSGAGTRAAAELAGRFGPDAVIADGPVAPALRRMWPELDSVVMFVSTDAAVRLIAPLVRDELTDPAVVCVDEQRRFALALSGGVGGAGNALAEQVADVLGYEPVVSGPAGAAGTVLDDVVDLTQATVDGDLAGCAAALVGGDPVRVVNPLGFALPPLPPNAAPDVENPSWTLVIDDRRPLEPEGPGTVRLIPRVIVVGLGAASDASRTAVAETVALLDTEHGIDPRSVRACATVDAKSAQQAILDAVQDLGFWNSPDGDELPLLHVPPEELDAIEVPNPSERVRSETGSASVAEAAALSAAGSMGAADLAVTKVKGRGATAAAARVLPRGRLAVVDAGPGEHDQRTPRADAELRRSSTIVGTEADVNRVRHLLRPGTDVRSPAPVSPADGLAEAVELARAGRAVALVGSAGAGMAEVTAGALELSGTDIELVTVPGASAVRVRPGR